MSDNTDNTRVSLKQIGFLIVLCASAIGILAGSSHLPPDVRFALERWAPFVVVAGFAWVVLRRLVHRPTPTEDASPQPALKAWQIVLVVAIFVAYYAIKLLVLTGQ